jgi:formylglycine-generating enzyme required for sulfatase activity
MRFVRVPGLNASFCIWPTRVQDFAEFAREAGSKVRSPDFEQSAAHPAVCVSWHDALAFCHWLTEQEHASGSLPENEEYRLPTDLEWSAAVGLPPEVGSKPRERHESTPTHFPWGATWPPPPNAGNYSQRLRVDEFPFTSAVGSFPANPIGIHDLGGNVWEWCSDDFDENGTESLRVLRGASWFYGEQEYLRSCFRNRSDPRYSNGNIGFRCVVGLKKA